jgi:hypothetical protein
MRLENQLDRWADACRARLDALGIAPEDYNNHLKEDERSAPRNCVLQLHYVDLLKKYIAANDTQANRDAIYQAMQLQELRWNLVMDEIEVDAIIGRKQRMGTHDIQTKADIDHAAWQRRFDKLRTDRPDITVRNAARIISNETGIPEETIRQRLKKP